MTVAGLRSLSGSAKAARIKLTRDDEIEIAFLERALILQELQEISREEDQIMREISELKSLLGTGIIYPTSGE
jgi:hypothetical protein